MVLLLQSCVVELTDPIIPAVFNRYFELRIPFRQQISDYSTRNLSNRELISFLNTNCVQIRYRFPGKNSLREQVGIDGVHRRVAPFTNVV